MDNSIGDNGTSAYERADGSYRLERAGTAPFTISREAIRDLAEQAGIASISREAIRDLAEQAGIATPEDGP